MAVALVVVVSLLGVPQRPASADDVEQRIADFWKRVDALGPSDLLTAADLGQWALNVTERDPGAGITVTDFRDSTTAMQAAFDRAGVGVPPGTPKSPDVEDRIARFWARVDALGPSDLLTASDLGQWATNVTDRDPNKRIRVDDFRASTAQMQAGFDRAKALPRPAAPTPAPTQAPSSASPAATSSPASVTCRMSVDGLPDASCTPGVAATAVTQANITQTICVSGYTDTVRPSTSYTTPLKIQQMAQYGFTGTTADYEEDHLIPLELGGDPRDAKNLWPQPYALLYGARQKDRVENSLHDQVCSGQTTLLAAQQQIAQNWISVYQTLFGAPTPAPATSAPTTAATPTPAPVSGAFTVTVVTSTYGYIAATTSPGASCTASARLPSGNLSSAQGLQGSKIADGSGSVSWTYGTSSTTLPGTGTHTVTCTYQGQTQTGTAPFSVP